MGFFSKANLQDALKKISLKRVAAGKKIRNPK